VQTLCIGTVRACIDGCADGRLSLLNHDPQASALSIRLRAKLYDIFSFSKLEVPATATTGTTIEVKFDVTNTGNVAGAEVAESYVSNPSARIQRPERELKGFEKVRLAPGETKHVTFSLDARAFSYWDEAGHKWAIDPGKFVIRVGDSSETTPLAAELVLQ